ncbi:Fatty acid-binding protein, partial [Armadillidium vulgare]
QITRLIFTFLNENDKSEKMSKILGSYVLESSDNFDNFMKALGIGLVTRTMANKTTPTIIFTEKGGVYTMQTVSTFKSYDINFRLGEEFDELSSDGRKCKIII